jgi:hypothetical protein
MCRHVLHTLALHGIVLILTLMLVGCNGRQPLRPVAGGSPYEVLVVGDRSGIVAQALQTDAIGLPQSEPEYEVSTVDSGKLGSTLRLTHSIVTVSINPQIYTQTSLHVERNVYADQQTVVRISTPSVRQLAADSATWAPKLRHMLQRNELQRALARLRRRRNVKAEKMVRQQFGVEMWIPEDMTASRKGNDWLWLSNNSATAMQNIVIYRAPQAQSLQGFIAVRDSATGRNIKGETDQMQMHTVAPSVTIHEMKIHGQPVVVCRGLWEMTGDDMGGPFVSHSRKGLIVEAFVFAPGQKKRNKMRQTEAVLYTIK